MTGGEQSPDHALEGIDVLLLFDNEEKGHHPRRKTPYHGASGLCSRRWDVVSRSPAASSAARTSASVWAPASTITDFSRRLASVAVAPASTSASPPSTSSLICVGTGKSN